MLKDDNDSFPVLQPPMKIQRIGMSASALVDAEMEELIALLILRGEQSAMTQAIVPSFDFGSQAEKNILKLLRRALENLMSDADDPAREPHRRAS